MNISARESKKCKAQTDRILLYIKTTFVTIIIIPAKPGKNTFFFYKLKQITGSIIGPAKAGPIGPFAAVNTY